MPPDSDAYKRYVKKFDTQETEIEQIMESVKKLQERQFKEQKDFEAFLADLNVD